MSGCRFCAERSRSAMARACAAVLCCMVLASCGLRKSRIVAEQGVRDFHALLNKEQYEAIYDASDDSLKRTWARADFVKYLAEVHSQLGPARKAATRGFQVNAQTGQGAEVALEMETEFQRGLAEERFIWRVNGDHAVLLDYRADIRRSSGPRTV